MIYHIPHYLNTANGILILVKDNRHLMFCLVERKARAGTWSVKSSFLMFSDVDNLESQTPDTDNRMIREETTEELVGDAAMEEHPQEADASKASEKELESLVSNGT